MTVPTNEPSGDRLSIVCPRCGRRSWQPEDVRQRYCGACHRWHDDWWVVLPALNRDEADTLYRLLDRWCTSHEPAHLEWPIVNSLRTAVGEARTR